MNEYFYDSRHRLIGSGAMSPIVPFQYNFSANYSRAGRFGHGFCGGISGTADVDGIYGYDDKLKTHQPRVIFDQESEIRTQLFWDGNGNLSQLMNCKMDFVRFHDWDDENRLRMVVDNTNAGFYGYDANGDRVYKLTGRSSITHINDEISDATVTLSDVVLYPNPYVTITPQGYAKHYYTNGELVETVFGEGGWCRMSQDVISTPQSQHEWDLTYGLKEISQNDFPFEYSNEPESDRTNNVNINGVELSGLQYDCPARHLRHIQENRETDLLYKVIEKYCQATDIGKEVYFRHSDHIGSASWITDYNGQPIQYMHYAPYGQL
jgi:hypothetical protein